jgi:RNA polymerase sigma-70 factor (ECF subfamily)
VNQAATQRADVSARGERTDASILGDVDTQLMMRVRDGDLEAANGLVRRNFSRVARYVARVVRTPGAVEDLTQDVFVLIFSNARQYEPRARFSTWLYRVATNRAMDYLKRARVRKRVASESDVSDHLSEQLADSSARGPGAEMDLTELKHRVSDALDALPVNQRVALTLFEYEDLSYEQIAAIMQVTVEAVRSLLSRGRANLRKRLSGLS